jgi:hypothetical protein
MDMGLLRILQSQVKLQCEYALLSAKALQHTVNAPRRTTIEVFFHLQNLLNAAANIGKTLWGVSGRKYEAARQPLRDSLGVSNDSPLRDVTVRNKFEHLDEYISDWWANSTMHGFVDMNLGNISQAIGGVPASNIFRSFDPANGNVSFLGWSCNTGTIISEIERILPLAIEKQTKISSLETHDST